jgi:pimeloyl-ACP methyl ester carboxylesterase
MRNTDKRHIKHLAFLVLLLSAMTAMSCASAKTPAINTPHGIASLEKVRLGRVDQWILIRGNDMSNPVLLFLHGGPGGAQMPYAHFYGYPLEEHFVVVHWDQRGAGKSFHLDIPAGSMNIDQFVSDAHELTLMLIERFGVDRIYLVGKSWGTLLGVRVVHLYPDLFYAYVGMGQCVDMPQNEAISYQFVWEEARKRKNYLAIATLKMIGPPPYRLTSDVAVQRIWLDKFGGVIYNEAGREARIGPESVEYTPLDRIKYQFGGIYSAALMWNEIMTVNFLAQAPKLDLPVYFFTGRHDYNTPFELVETYYEILDAPKGKKIIWFENSGHSPNFEETEKFAEEMLKVLHETYPGNR